ncbi:MULTISPECIES: acetyl-CoA carboxylase, carboxyltransferase subunit beta [Parachlamydia]|uniref:Acetyl-coenzyme A carboxylase carboxyl transferase subunit beta n=2 Tax=Parachlamydia acanthamoebae TaxID=83552 RepID=F8KWM2_PARAV|nr:acetyl-CoA carboxylase, carboxyltransferase subunit beta [Parachlamydia acanthamoebae]KIA76098.1 Acetyl-coenzyme A carboxylase carboxyl transferase subunit beta [Parachlamydia acanthamoebae]CCB85429.1 acetyl-coenzyme A carboxylase carboxyl transferase subunit beta [Parachlamydia acanthamoebae UV-7]
MGLFSRDKPKIKIQTTKKDGFSGWLKCTHCNELIHTNQIEQNNNCCPKCDYHYRLSVEERLKSLADPDSFQVMFTEYQPVDSLGFVDTEPYPQRLTAAREKSGRDEAVLVGRCLMGGRPVALGIMDFQFMGGSMGSVVGERLTLLMEYALSHHLPLVIVSTSGGARMQESVLSLMQMAKTSGALAKLHEAKIPYISVLTNPTTGGVTASFASLGDIIIAEPNALICFAGPRVIEQTIGQQLPPGAQKSEFLLKHGMIDCIVRRPELKGKIVEFLDFLAADLKEVTPDSSQEGGKKKGGTKR